MYVCVDVVGGVDNINYGSDSSHRSSALILPLCFGDGVHLRQKTVPLCFGRKFVSLSLLPLMSQLRLLPSLLLPLLKTVSVVMSQVGDIVFVVVVVVVVVWSLSCFSKNHNHFL